MADHDGDAWLEPRPLPQLSGTEQLGDTGTTLDFWRWAFSDLRDNTIRGALAEYLVARAVGDDRTQRVGWDDWDITAPDGTRIEVKAAGFLQSWRQARPSRITFSRLSGRAWNADQHRRDEAARIRADVFVFAVQTCRDPLSYDPLDLRQWDFYPLRAETVRIQATKSVSLSWVQQHTTATPHAQLASAIASATNAR